MQDQILFQKRWTKIIDSCLSSDAYRDIVLYSLGLAETMGEEGSQALAMIKMEIDEYNEKIKEISEKRRKAGKKGLDKRWCKKTDDSKNSKCYNSSENEIQGLQNTHSTQETNKEKRSKKENKKEDYIPEEREKECVCKNAHANEQPNLSTHTHTQASPSSTQTTNNEDNPKVKEYNSFVNWVKTTYPAYYGNENTVRMITGIQYSRLRMQYTKNQVARAMEELGANQKSIDERRYNEIYTPLRSYLERLTAK